MTVRIMKTDSAMSLYEEGPPTLEWLQEQVGGYIEVVPVPGNQQLIVNEEGLLRGLKFNSLATMIADRRIVGDAVLLSEDDVLT